MKENSEITSQNTNGSTIATSLNQIINLLVLALFKYQFFQLSIFWVFDSASTLTHNR